MNRNGGVKVEKYTGSLSGGNCNFCSSREMPSIKIFSSNPNRNMVQYACQDCQNELFDRLFNLRYGEPKA